MKLEIDTDAKTVWVRESGESREMPIYSREAFELLSSLWLKLSWNQKYSYTFSWLGRPIIQHPEDMIRLQEVIFSLKPSVIIETGVAHGGSLIYYASLFHAMERPGRVVGIDIEIRPHNKAEILSHAMSRYISLIEGSSTSPETLATVQREIRTAPPGPVLVLLDSDHSYDHVMKELELYAPLVSVGSYVVSTDGIMREVFDTPRGNPHWVTDNPANAAEDFAATNKNFVIEMPQWTFNESDLDKAITTWPSAWLRRIA